MRSSSLSENRSRTFKVGEQTAFAKCVQTIHDGDCKRPLSRTTDDSPLTSVDEIAAAQVARNVGIESGERNAMLRDDAIAGGARSCGAADDVDRLFVLVSGLQFGGAWLRRGPRVFGGAFWCVFARHWRAIGLCRRCRRVSLTERLIMLATASILLATSRYVRPSRTDKTRNAPPSSKIRLYSLAAATTRKQTTKTTGADLRLAGSANLHVFVGEEGESAFCASARATAASARLSKIVAEATHRLAKWPVSPH